MEASPTSPKTATPSSLFGKKEMRYLTRLAPALQNPSQASTVAMWLEKAKEDGLDPQRIYEAAVKARPPHWMKALDYSEVAPK
ncbi:MAG: hypothetical protein JSR31_08685 [Nitrospira sp.]|nr:hypothetical protein [Nitrospira sp.]